MLIREPRPHGASHQRPEGEREIGPRHQGSVGAVFHFCLIRDLKSLFSVEEAGPSPLPTLAFLRYPPSKRMFQKPENPDGSA